MDNYPEARWIAVTDVDDEYHRRATDYYPAKTAIRVPLITSDFVLDEAITRIRYDLRHRPTILFIQRLHRSIDARVLQVEPITSYIWNRAEVILSVYKDTELSFTDCTSFALLQQIDVDKVFGFDSHFEMMGHVLALR